MDHNLITAINNDKNDENADDSNKDKKINTIPKSNVLLFKPIITISIHKHKKK